MLQRLLFTTIEEALRNSNRKTQELERKKLNDRFHDDFHTRSFSGLPFSMFQY